MTNEYWGILGGAFDPPHCGHIAMCRAAARELRVHRRCIRRLCRVSWGAPPHVWNYDIILWGLEENGYNEENLLGGGSNLV